MADLEAVLSAVLHKNVELDLTRAGTIFEEGLDDDYTFTIKYNNTTMSMSTFKIYINDNETYTIYYSAQNLNGYVNFSVVSDKLNQPTNQQ